MNPRLRTYGLNGQSYKSNCCNRCFLKLSLGLCCLGLAFIPKSAKYAILSVYLLGKGASGAGFQMVWMYTNELYPTNLRGQVQNLKISIIRIVQILSSVPPPKKPLIHSLKSHFMKSSFKTKKMKTMHGATQGV